MTKYKFIDLFAGCGGLEDGFLQSGKYEDVAAVEWLKPQVNTLVNRLKTKWKIDDSHERVMHFDIQREDELFNGWNDPEFGTSKGLDYFVNDYIDGKSFEEIIETAKSKEIGEDNDRYTYSVDGNIDKEELVKIAQNIE